MLTSVAFLYYVRFNLAVKSMQVCRYNRGASEQGSLHPAGSLFSLPRASSSSYFHLPLGRSETLGRQEFLSQAAAEHFTPHTGLPMAPLQTVVSLYMRWTVLLLFMGY